MQSSPKLSIHWSVITPHYISILDLADVYWKLGNGEMYAHKATQWKKNVTLWNNKPSFLYVGVFSFQRFTCSSRWVGQWYLRQLLLCQLFLYSCLPLSKQPTKSSFKITISWYVVFLVLAGENQIWTVERLTEWSLFVFWDYHQLLHLVFLNLIHSMKSPFLTRIFSFRKSQKSQREPTIECREAFMNRLRKKYLRLPSNLVWIKEKMKCLCTVFVYGNNEVRIAKVISRKQLTIFLGSALALSSDFLMRSSWCSLSNLSFSSFILSRLSFSLACWWRRIIEN